MTQQWPLLTQPHPVPSSCLLTAASFSTRKLSRDQSSPSLALPPEHCHYPLRSRDLDLDEKALAGSLDPYHFTDMPPRTELPLRGNVRSGSHVTQVCLCQ